MEVQEKLKINNTPLTLMAERQEYRNDWKHRKTERTIVLRRIEQGELSLRCGKVYRLHNGLEEEYQGPKGSNLQGLLVKFFQAGLIQIDTKKRMHLTEPGRWLLTLIEAQELELKRKIKELRSR